jgi:hypothetical protein
MPIQTPNFYRAKKGTCNVCHQLMTIRSPRQRLCRRCATVSASLRTTDPERIMVEHRRRFGEPVEETTI